MKKISYSSKMIRILILTGMVLWGVVLCGFFVLAVENGKISEKEGILLSAGIVWCLIFFGFMYQKVYKSTVQLETLVKEYWKNQNQDAEYGKNPIEYNLLKDIEKIFLSLDAMSIRQKNAEILMKNAEINNLQDQINPHFLYNTLEVIRGEALVKGEKKLAQMTASLANYFRYNISRKDSFVFLKDELKNSMNYFNIQKNRFGDKISCEILYHDVEEEQINNSYIPKLILQPVIENAIYHGLEMKIGKGIIRIHITAADNNLKITVTDDGVGMTQEKQDELNSDRKVIQETEGKKHNGVAMKNIRNRLKLYWGDAAYMMITSELDIGTQVHLSMPIQYQIEEFMSRQ